MLVRALVGFSGKNAKGEDIAVECGDVFTLHDGDDFLKVGYCEPVKQNAGNTSKRAKKPVQLFAGTQGEAED